MGPTDVFSSTPARVLTVSAAVAAVLGVVSLIGDVSATDLVGTAALAALAVLLVWAVLGRPSVEVSDGGVVLHNVLRTVTIPWPTVQRVEVGWSLVVHTTAGRWTAWAAPRSSGGAVHRRRGGRGGVDRGPDDRRADGGHGPATAEAVGAAIETRLDALRGAGYLDHADRVVAAHGLRPTVTWHASTVLAALGLVVVAAGTRIL